MKRIKKSFVITITTLLTVAFLTFNVGKVTRVYAIGTTVAAAAGATLCAVGIAYCSYMLLTGAAVHIPDTIDNVHDWLSDMGSKVVQYPAGREAYEEIYPQMLNHNGNALLHDFLDSEVWTWTAAKLRSWANDFSDTSVISSIAGSYLSTVDTSLPTTHFAYNFSDFELINDTVNVNGSYYSLADWYGSLTVDFPVGQRYIIPTNADRAVYTNLYTNYLFRNAFRNGFYTVEYLDTNTNTWVTPSLLDFCARVLANQSSDVIYWLSPQIPASNSSDSTWYQNSHVIYTNNVAREYPPLADADIYDYDNDVVIPVDVPEPQVVDRPQWPDIPVDDDDYDLPVPIPYLEVPFDPTWIDPITGNGGGGNWGFNLGDLLDMLEDLANTLIQIGILADLINDFKNSLTGDPSDAYYIYYDDSENNYYDYYTITNFGDNTQYIYNYNYDVSETDKHLPVDLNTIGTYSNNRYVDTFKRVADAGSSIVGDLVAFWHNVDPDIIYTFFGCAIITLIAAFIGKWGHS